MLEGNVAMKLKSVGRFFQSTGRFIYYFRKVFMAIPVVVVAIMLARHNQTQLPETVGLILSAQGTFAVSLTRAQATWGPAILTGGCLLCMFVSRKAFYPWLISVITLIIPPLLLLLNQFFG